MGACEKGEFFSQEYVGLVDALRNDLWKLLEIDNQAVMLSPVERTWRGGYIKPKSEGEDLELMLAFNETQHESTIYFGFKSPDVDRLLIMTSKFKSPLVAYGRFSSLIAKAKEQRDHRDYSPVVFMAFEASIEELREFERIGRIAVSEVKSRSQDE